MYMFGKRFLKEYGGRTAHQLVITFIGCDMKILSTIETQKDAIHSADFSGPNPPAISTVAQNATPTTAADRKYPTNL